MMRNSTNGGNAVNTVVWQLTTVRGSKPGEFLFGRHLVRRRGMTTRQLGIVATEIARSRTDRSSDPAVRLSDSNDRHGPHRSDAQQCQQRSRHSDYM